MGEQRQGLDAEALFRRYALTGDSRLRIRLINIHANMVRFLARKFVGHGLALEDLAQVGMIGLVHAVDRYDYTRGVKFSVYATRTVVGEIRNYIRDISWAIRAPRRLQELNVSAVKAQDALIARLGRRATVPEIAHELGLSPEETLEALELGLFCIPRSLSTPTASSTTDPGTVIGDLYGEDDPRIATLVDNSELNNAIATLDDRERIVIIRRFIQEMSQSDVADEMNISQMHVSRIQTKALRSLSRILSE